MRFCVGFLVCVFFRGKIKTHSYYSPLREQERVREGGSGIIIRGIQSTLYVNAEPVTQRGHKKGEWIISESACYKAQAG